MTAMCDNSTVVAYVNKQGGKVSHSLCLLASRLLRWTESLDIHLSASYLPGQSNVLAYLLSRRDQIIGTKWSPPLGGESCASTLGPTVNRCFCDASQCEASPILFPHSGSPGGLRGCVSSSLGQPGLYAFPHFPLAGRVVARVRETANLSMTLVAPLWPEEWFADLLLLLTQPPLALPWWDRLLRKPLFNRFHHGIHGLNLHAWRLSSVSSKSWVFREDLRLRCPAASGHPLPACTRPSGCSSVVGVVEGALLQSAPLFP